MDDKNKTYKKYTDRDIVDIRASAIDTIKKSGSKWNDFNESDLGMILIETISGIVDYSNYYLDNQALESNLMTARQPKNIKGILEGYNIKLKTLGSALGEVDFYLDEPTYAVIPSYTQLKSINGVYYVTTKPKIITEEFELISVPVMQGSRYIEHVDSNVLKSNYKYYLKTENVPIDSVTISQKDQSWEKVEDAFIEIEGGAKYSVHEDNYGRVYLLFTYNAKDYLPVSDTEAVDIYYVKSIGSKGVVPPLHITGLVDTIKDSNGNSVNNRIRVSNQYSTYGAYDKINFEKLKVVARNHILTMGRYITLSDYKAGIEIEPYVIDSYTCDWRLDAERVFRPYQVKSWVLTTDSLLETQETLPALKELSNKMMDKGDVAVEVQVFPAIAVDIDFNITLGIRGSSKFQEETRDKVIKYIRNKFSLYNLKLGDMIEKERFEIEISKVSSSILSVEIDSMKDSQILKCNDIEFFKLNELIVSVSNFKELGYDPSDLELWRNSLE